MGLEEACKGRFQLFDLPSGAETKIEDFSEVKRAQENFKENPGSIENKLFLINQKLIPAQKPLVVTEGKTDWMHLKSAFPSFANDPDLASLDFELLEYGDDYQMNDSELKSFCKYLAKVPLNRKIICMFDRDVDHILKEMSGEPGNFKKWDNNLYSFCIPIPSHRIGYEFISIEFFYKDSEILTIDPTTNRRLYFSHEILENVSKNPNTKKDEITKIITQPRAGEELQKKIYCKDVEKIRDQNGNLVAHSKTIFADNILNGKPGFDQFSFLEFKMIFLKIKEIINEKP